MARQDNAEDEIVSRCLLEPVATLEVQINGRHPLAVFVLRHGSVLARIPFRHAVDPQPREMVQLLIEFQRCVEPPAVFHFLSTVIPAIAANMPSRSYRRILTCVANRALGSARL